MSSDAPDRPARVPIGLRATPRALERLLAREAAIARYAAPALRRTVYEVASLGWRDTASALPLVVVAALPGDLRVTEARRHLALPDRGQRRRVRRADRRVRRRARRGGHARCPDRVRPVDDSLRLTRPGYPIGCGDGEWTTESGGDSVSDPYPDSA